MLYLGNVLSRYILIYNLEVSFNVHLTFLHVQLTVIIIHSKYFSNSDWLKAHEQFTITSYL